MSRGARVFPCRTGQVQRRPVAAVEQQHDARQAGDPRPVAGLRPADIKYGQALSSRTKDEFINLRSIVDIVEPMGDVTTIYVTAGPHRLTAQIDGQNKIAESDTLDLAFDPSRLYLFDEVSGVSLL